MKRILVMSDLTFGGAAIVCRRLVSGLASRPGLEIQWTAACGDSSVGAVVASNWLSLFPLLRYRMAMRLSRSDVAQRRAEIGLHGKNVLRSVRRFRPDLINLHNIHVVMSFSMVENLPKDIPLVWTLHDMWPLTGYCCHSHECRKYMTGCCGNCPQMGQWRLAVDPPDREWRRRQSFFIRNRDRMTFVAPSRWLADRVKERFDGRLRAEWIPNGIDLSIFKPIVDKDAVRHALGLPAGKKVILAVAHSFESECKGKAHLVQAAELLSSRWGDALAIVVVGHWREDTRPHSPIWSFRDSIQDEDLLNLYYNAADVLVLPSSAENLPNTLIEAMAAGVPCVAFRVGGCPEIVRQGERVKTGFLARPYDKEDLALGIDRILALSQEQKNEMSLCCRRVVEQDYSIRVQAQRYDDLFGARIASHE